MLFVSKGLGKKKLRKRLQLIIIGFCFHKRETSLMIMTCYDATNDLWFNLAAPLTKQPMWFPVTIHQQVMQPSPTAVWEAGEECDRLTPMEWTSVSRRLAQRNISCVSQLLPIHIFLLFIYAFGWPFYPKQFTFINYFRASLPKSNVGSCWRVQQW